MQNKHDIKLSLKKGYVVSHVDGERIPFCRSVDEKGNGIKFSIAEHAVDYLASDVPCDLSEYVRFACIVLRDELLKHGDLYRGFSASIYSALNEISEGTFIDEMPEIILRRIIGEE